ncbi:MAG: TIGR04255 family protein [Limnobacter sp.]|uniref:TIGR04255 family protein n=1 Tax=Limnobacter sp. TaxID=2003368 RepID=UPI00391A94D6
MKIQHAERVRYAVNPLIEVVAQLRFSPIFALEKDVLPTIQSQLHEAGFSVLRSEKLASITVTVNASPDAVTDVTHNSQSSDSTQIYHFSTENQLHTFSICKDFVALTTRAYSQWTEFNARLTSLCNIFEASFKPISIFRVGLRYKDLIEREPLNLQDMLWSDLLNPIVAGFLSTTGFVDKVDESCVLQQTSQTVLCLDDCELLLQSALLRASDNPEKQAFLIDSDFYTVPKLPIDMKTALNSLDLIHRSANAVFQNCIKEPLSAALCPTRD